jgi:hypothetical protein
MFEYWDQREDAIAQSAAALNELDENGVQSTLARLATHVGDMARAAPSKLLAQTAFVMADDLYKAASVTQSWDRVLASYLTASAGTFTSVLAERGLIVAYAVDNTFAADNMQRPLTVFGPWFASAGFVYICPQAIATELARQTGESTENAAWDARLLAEARDVANQLVSRCWNERRHYMYLDADFQIDSLDFIVNQSSEVPGIISVFRNQPPLPDTEAQVHFPADV